MFPNEISDTFKVRPYYRPPCRIGNWHLDGAMEESKQNLVAYKRYHSQLLVGKTRYMLRKVLDPTTLSKAVEELYYGDAYQIVAPELPNFVDLQTTKTKGLYLSGLMSEQDIDLGTDFMHGCLVTASPEKTSCRRNTFSLISSQARSGVICYGEQFYIQMYTPVGASPLYIQAESNTLDSFGSPMYARLSKAPDVYCNFKILDRRPRMRKHTLQTKILPNTNVIIQHVASGRNLAVEIYNWIPTLFGPEAIVTCHNFKDYNRIETAENVWKIISKREPDKGMMIRAAKGEDIPPELLE